MIDLDNKEFTYTKISDHLFDIYYVHKTGYEVIPIVKSLINRF